jgi:rare lipoprotein A (peptidoglycan hydrolase)
VNISKIPRHSRSGFKLPAAALFSAGVVLLIALLTQVPSATAEPTSAEISSRISSQQAELEKTRLQLAALDLEISNREQTLQNNRLALADATSQLQDAEDRYDATLRLYEGRISAIYKMGDGEAYIVLLTSDDFSGVLTRLSYLQNISENDRRLVARVKDDAETVRELQEQIDSIKQASAEDVEAMKDRRAELDLQIQSGQSQMTVSLEELAKAEARERDEETRRLAAEAAAFAAASQQEEDTGSMSLMGSSVLSSPGPPDGLRPSGVVLRGVASWYGPGFQGNHTANGETYNMYGLTAAHKSLPFNTWLKVTYNGRSVFVRINDRGPYVGSRILDLSLAGAQSVGLSGVGYVTAEVYR